MKPRIAIILSFLLVLTAAYGQSDGTIHVKSFPGNDVGTKVANAMATCPTAGAPCLLVIDASLAGWAPGTMPTLCAKCTIADYRSGFVTPLSSTAPQIDPRAATYGALCNWNGTSGNDDTGAFQAAVNAAAAIYTASGSPVYVTVPSGCEIAGQVTIRSGVRMVGPGSVIIPNQNPTTGPTFYFVNASNAGASDIVFTVLSQTGCYDNPTCAAVYWGGTAAASYAGVTFNRLKIHNSDWGISVFISSGSGSGTLSDLSITDNLVDSPTVYTNGDGIHVGGSIVNYTVANNRVYNRNDAGIACTTEDSATYINSGGNFTGNTVINSAVGLDNSGCVHSKWTGNVVEATVPIGGTSNPAARVITYGGQCSQDVLLSGNTLRNATGGVAYTVQVDVGTCATNQSIKVTNNYVAADQGGYAIAANGSGITVSGNTIAAGGVVDFNYDNPTVSSNGILGTNTWEGAGTIIIGTNAGLESNMVLWPQAASGTLSYTNLANWITAITPPGGTFGINGGIAATSTVSAANGLFSGDKATSVSALSTNYVMTGSGGSAGILHVRDNTSGGSAAFLLDPNGGAQLLGTSQITGLAAGQILWNQTCTGCSGNWSVELTSGTVPRTLIWTIYQ
jgi:hypothetical protein